MNILHKGNAAPFFDSVYSKAMLDMLSNVQMHAHFCLIRYTLTHPTNAQSSPCPFNWPQW